MSLIALANRKEWEYGTDFLIVDSAKDCDAIINVFADKIAEFAFKSKRPFNILWGDNRLSIPPDQYNLIKNGEIMSVSTSDFYGLTIASLDLDEILLNLFFDEFLPSPEKRIGLIRRSDLRQVAISHGVMSNVLRPGVTKEQVVQRTSWDYGYWPDLEAISTDLRLLTPNDSNSSAIATLRMHDTTGRNWRKSESRIRLIQDSQGILYSLSESLNVERCPVPFSA
jgi:hypothetical protein